jgi:hypothetical protein
MSDKSKLILISFLQALGLAVYCILVGSLILSGEALFGSLSGLFGAALFLLLFATSALVCGLLVFGYPAILFLQKKRKDEAIQIVLYTAGWLVAFVLTSLLLFVIF